MGACDDNAVCKMVDAGTITINTQYFRDVVTSTSHANAALADEAAVALAVGGADLKALTVVTDFAGIAF